MKKSSLERVRIFVHRKPTRFTRGSLFCAAQMKKRVTSFVNGLIKRGEGSCPSLFCVRIFQTGPHKIDLKLQQFYHIRSFREKL